MKKYDNRFDFERKYIWGDFLTSYITVSYIFLQMFLEKNALLNILLLHLTFLTAKGNSMVGEGMWMRHS